MFYVYILQNKNNLIYIGYSADLKRRVIEHNNGKVKSTRSKGPWRLVYYEAFLGKQDAQNREKTLKNYGSTLGHLKKRIQFSLLA